MYAGTTIRTKSGRIMGTHQQIDRLARRNLQRHLPRGQFFPNISQILLFEGGNGPDAIKRKSPSVDEPWHYIDPEDPSDKDLLLLIEGHIYNLAKALKAKDETRASFESAWLAHAVVDGLTPAHHDGFAKKIEELWGKPHTERKSFREKNIIRGINHADTIRKNWTYWGGGGVFTAHYMFELGVATTLRSMKYSDRLGANGNDLITLKRDGYEKVFLEALHKVHALDMYTEFKQKRWTRELATQTKQELMPQIVRAVVLAWTAAVQMADK